MTSNALSPLSRLLSLVVRTATAHHAAAGIEPLPQKTVELKGTNSRPFSWQNPHSWMASGCASRG
jgi:hypothetical protein